VRRLVKAANVGNVRLSSYRKKMRATPALRPSFRKRTQLYRDDESHKCRPRRASERGAYLISLPTDRRAYAPTVTSLDPLFGPQM
jgi:hypothetical protein